MEEEGNKDGREGGESRGEGERESKCKEMRGEGECEEQEMEGE